MKEKKSISVEELKAMIFKMCSEGGICGPEIWIEFFKKKDEMRQLAENESWGEYECSEMEEWIAEGEKASHNREQTNKYKKYFDAIFSELVSMDKSWKIHKGIFIDNHCSVAAIHKHFPGSLLNQIKRSLSHDVLLTITKLITDSKNFYDKEKLTFEQLLDKTLPADKKIPLMESLKNIKKSTVAKDLKKWRDNRVSHFNLDIALNPSLLPNIKDTDIDEIIKDIQKLFNEIGSIVHSTGYICSAEWIKEQIERLNDLFKNGARMQFLSSISSSVTNGYNTKGKFSDSFLLHSDIVKEINSQKSQADELGRESFNEWADNSFIDISKITDGNSNKENHESPF